MTPDGDEIVKLTHGGKKEGFVVATVMMGVVLYSGVKKLLETLRKKENNNRRNL